VLIKGMCFFMYATHESACDILRVMSCLHLHIVSNFLFPLCIFLVFCVGIVAAECFTENLSSVMLQLLNNSSCLSICSSIFFSLFDEVSHILLILDIISGVIFCDGSVIITSDVSWFSLP
jgi:hypothetical protein